MLKNTLEYVLVVGQLLGYILIIIALWRFRKTLREHRKTSNNDFLSESEKPIQNKSIIILIIGLSFIFITFLIEFILFIIGI
jgi:amino acid transporter